MQKPCSPAQVQIHQPPLQVTHDGTGSPSAMPADMSMKLAAAYSQKLKASVNPEKLH